MAVLAEQLREGFGGHGLTEKIPLNEIRAFAEQEVELLQCFDAFGHDLNAKSMRHGNDRANDGRRVFVTHRIFDEGTIDFEHIDGQLL